MSGVTCMSLRHVPIKYLFVQIVKTISLMSIKLSCFIAVYIRGCVINIDIKLKVTLQHFLGLSY